jgi:hypothetical protein
MIRSILLALSLVTAAVTLSNGQEVQPGRYAIQVVFTAEGETEPHVFTWRRADWATKRECEDALQTAQMAQEIFSLGIQVAARLGKGVEVNATCEMQGTPA